jgi:hypothetical protein
MENVLETINDHLMRQEEARKHSEDKITEFIETRVKELESEKIVIRKK